MRRVQKTNNRRRDDSLGQIVVIGANDIGYHLAAALGNKDQNTFLIDEKENLFPQIDEEIDVLTIPGDPIVSNTLKNAGVGEETRLITVTNSDKLNLLLLFLAQNFGVKEGYALIRDQEYYHSFWPIVNRLGSNLRLINLWQLVMQTIEKRYHLETQVIYTDNQRNNLLFSIRFLAGHPQIGKPVSQLKSGKGCRILKLIKNGDSLSEFNLKLAVGDIILVSSEIVGPKKNMSKLIPFSLWPKIMIGGDGLIQSFYQQWPNFTTKLVCIEKNYSRCEKILTLIGNGLLLRGDALDISLLKEAGIDETAIFIAASETDEVNLLASLLATSFGVKDVFTILKRRQHTGLLERLQLNGIISLPQLAVEHLLAWLIPRYNKNLLQTKIKIETEQLSPGIHLIFRGDSLIPLEQSKLRAGEELLTIQMSFAGKRIFK